MLVTHMLGLLRELGRYVRVHAGLVILQQSCLWALHVHVLCRLRILLRIASRNGASRRSSGVGSLRSGEGRV